MSKANNKVLPGGKAFVVPSARDMPLRGAIYGSAVRYTAMPRDIRGHAACESKRDAGRHALISSSILLKLSGRGASKRMRSPVAG